MLTKYIASANNTTNGAALGAAGQDVYVKTLLIGTPVAAGTVILYDKTIAYSGDTSNIAYKLTEPTAAAGNNLVYQVDFCNGGNTEGLQLDGGNVMVTGSNADVTVIYEIADQGK